ncbi:hypothetical protein IMY05_C2488000900 [Salix suchowensis]|nr:hypothetical protein IMY05_C2488000900 [Salix suchowensis]
MTVSGRQQPFSERLMLTYWLMKQVRRTSVSSPQCHHTHRQHPTSNGHGLETLRIAHLDLHQEGSQRVDRVECAFELVPIDMRKEDPSGQGTQLIPKDLQAWARFEQAASVEYARAGPGRRTSEGFDRETERESRCLRSHLEQAKIPWRRCEPRIECPGHQKALTQSMKLGAYFGRPLPSPSRVVVASAWCECNTGEAKCQEASHPLNIIVTVSRPDGVALGGSKLSLLAHPGKLRRKAPLD